LLKLLIKVSISNVLDFCVSSKHFMLQFSRGKAATEQAARLSHFLPPVSAGGLPSPFLFERLSLTFFTFLVPACPG
jgi:hypothetical protein